MATLCMHMHACMNAVLACVYAPMSASPMPKQTNTHIHVYTDVHMDKTNGRDGRDGRDDHGHCHGRDDHSGYVTSGGQTRQAMMAPRGLVR